MIKHVQLLLLIIFSQVALSQGGFGGGGSQFSLNSSNVSYETPKDYEIGGIVVDGVYSYDSERILALSGLRRGKTITIPGDDITQAVRKLWDQNLFSDVQIYKEKVTGNTIFLKVVLKERKRLSKYKILGTTKSQAKSIRENLDLYMGKIITDATIDRVKYISRDFFVDKGFLNTEVDIRREIDTSMNNSEKLTIIIDKKNKVKIKEINVIGNDAKVPRKGVLKYILLLYDLFPFAVL